jgi:hypothetical protein
MGCLASNRPSTASAGGDEQHGSGVDADAVDVQQLRGGGVDARSELRRVR